MSLNFFNTFFSTVKRLVTVTLLLYCLFILCIGGLLYSFYYLSEPEPTDQGFSLINSSFEYVASDLVSEFDYERGVFDCDDFSTLLVHKLSLINKSGRVVVGWLRGRHAWVECFDCGANGSVFIEATSGKVINSSDYMLHYVADENYSVAFEKLPTEQK